MYSRHSSDSFRGLFRSSRISSFVKRRVGDLSPVEICRAIVHRLEFIGMSRLKSPLSRRLLIADNCT